MPLVPRRNDNTVEVAIKPENLSFRRANNVIWQAEREFRELKRAKDKKRALRKFKAKWPGYVPEPFKTNGSYKTRKGYESLRGKTPIMCGPVGKLRVMSGSYLWWSRITFLAMGNELAAIEYKVEAQFTKKDIAKVAAFLESNIVGPFIAVVERGRLGRNHVHVLHGEGACSLGNSTFIPDDKLPDKAGYIYKNPYWCDENVLAYLEATDNGKKAPGRI